MRNKHLNLQIGMYNVRGLKKRMTEVNSLAETIDVLGLCETWARNTDEELLQITDGYVNTVPAHHRCRGYRGVAWILHPCLKFRVINKIVDRKVQGMTIALGDVAISIVYVSPYATGAEMVSLMDRLRKEHRGRALIMGDLNTRPTLWDNKINARGRMLVKWVSAHGWKLATSNHPTFVTPNGSSTPDIFLYKGIDLPQVHIRTDQLWSSDHRPLQATLRIGERSKRGMRL